MNGRSSLEDNESRPSTKDAGATPDQSDPTSLITLLYKMILGREVEPEALAARVAAMDAGVPFVDLFLSIATSEEARLRIERQSIFGAERVRLWPIVVETIYRRVLGRGPTADELALQTEGLRAGLLLEDVILGIFESEEARVRANFDNERARLGPIVLETIYRRVLGRGPTANELAMQTEALRAGLLVEEVILGIFDSEEATRRATFDEERARLWPLAIDIIYRRLLDREPTATELTLQIEGLQAGVPLEQLLINIFQSDEAKLVLGRKLLAPQYSDGAFLVSSSGILFDTGLTARDLVFWQNYVDESPAKRIEATIGIINDYLRRRVDSESSHGEAIPCYILGSDRKLTRREWDERRKKVTEEADPDLTLPSSTTSVTAARTFEHSGTYIVSMIASLYKGGPFIRRFLENITSQSLFHSAELIIIDADSPDGESDTIRDYQQLFPNIVYQRINHRIGVYEAWNVAAKIARGRYLTNTNLDDLRRSDSIELQAAMLNGSPEVDVVYQDFYYSLEPDLSFEEIAACGFRSQLPIITGNNLLLFNSPHNAPMWRATLHHEVGWFDSRYRSAGDHEFWARCLVAGKNFRKINAPHVAYYQNPDGVSTRPNTLGIEEGRDVIRRYNTKLISPSLQQSRRDFHASLGINQGEGGTAKSASYYDIVQAELLRLSATRVRPSTPNA